MTDASEASLFPYRRSVRPYVSHAVGRVCSRRVRIVAYARSRSRRRRSDVRVGRPWSKILRNCLGNVHEDGRRRKPSPGRPRQPRVLHYSFHPTKRNRIKISIIIKNSYRYYYIDNDMRQRRTMQPKCICAQN